MVGEGIRRRSMRLHGYDYAQAGAYFVTICVQDRECLFGEVKNGEVCLNQHGALVAQAWADLPKHYRHIELDRFVIMPNHFHGIVVLTIGAGLEPTSAKRHGLPEIVRAFKTFSARHINQIRQSPGTSVWQRNYYEHIIRNEADYDRIAEYIENNPAKWAEDSLHPDRTTVGAGFKPAQSHPPDAQFVGAGLKPAPTTDRKGTDNE